MTAYRRPVLLTLLAMWVAVVAFLTLSPAGYTPPLTLRSFLCVGCGMFDGSDIIRNWILFVPGGLLAGLVLRPKWAWSIPICFTALIEIIQVGVPGREPALQDLVFNSLGGITGVILARFGLARWSQRVLSGAAVVAWLAPLVLLVPKTTPFDLYGQWTPRFGNVAQYRGRIVDASIDGLTIESRMVRDKETLDAAIIDRKPLRLLVATGPAPASWAPVFQIVDGEQQGVLELGALGPDLILRGRNPARVLKLDQPDARWSGAMSGVAVGDTVPIVVDRGRGSVCMSVGEREQCNLAPSLADGWGHVLYLEGPPAWFRSLMSLLWAVSLGGVIGLTTSSRRQAMALAMTVAIIGYVGSLISPDVRPSALHAAVLVCGAFIGAMTRSPIARLWRAIRPV
jgi:hypothetical protein